MPLELKYKLHNNTNVKFSVVPNVYADRMKAERKDNKLFSFLAAYLSPIVLQRR